MEETLALKIIIIIQKIALICFLAYGFGLMIYTAIKNKLSKKKSDAEAFETE